jgi:hypothetical protein
MKFFLSLLFIFYFCFNPLFLNSQIIDESNNIVEDDLLSYVEDFIDLPKGGTSWKIFGETSMDEYQIIDEDGNEWIGVKPIFNEDIYKINSKRILVQGYMFPLEQSEEQSMFLLGPFPLSCPYHPHTPSNLLIEVHAKNPIVFSYDAVNIKGKLELVPKDDDYNIFFRLRDAELSFD